MDAARWAAEACLWAGTAPFKDRLAALLAGDAGPIKISHDGPPLPPQEALRFTEQLALLAERHCAALQDFTGRRAGWHLQLGRDGLGGIQMSAASLGASSR